MVVPAISGRSGLFPKSTLGPASGQKSNQREDLLHFQRLSNISRYMDSSTSWAPVFFVKYIQQAASLALTKGGRVLYFILTFKSN